MGHNIMSCVLVRGLIRTNIYTCSMRSKTSHLVAAVTAVMETNDGCFQAPAALLIPFMLCSVWRWCTAQIDHLSPDCSQEGHVVAKSLSHPTCTAGQERGGDLRIIASSVTKCAPTVQPNLLKGDFTEAKERGIELQRRGTFWSPSGINESWSLWLGEMVKSQSVRKPKGLN